MSQPEYVAVVLNDGTLRVEKAENAFRQPIYPQLSRWQRVVRALTPPRWRKPLRPINDPLARHQRVFEGMLQALATLEHR